MYSIMYGIEIHCKLCTTCSQTLPLTEALNTHHTMITPVRTNDTEITLCQVTGHGTRWYVFKYSCSEHTDNHFKDLIAKNQETYGLMFVPLIIGSDKTVVSVATGQTEYHPLYLSIGNIYNSVQCAHHRGVVLIGFLVIPKCRYPHLLFVLNYILILFV